MRLGVLLLAMMTAQLLLAAENRLTALKDGTAFSLEDVPDAIVVERCKDTPVRFLLAENATTGYRWEVEWNTNECSVALDHRAPNTQDGRCGAPGQMEVLIMSKIYTPVRIEFRYARPWEKDALPLKALKAIVYTVGKAKSPLYPRSAVNRLPAAECAKRARRQDLHS